MVDIAVDRQRLVLQTLAETVGATPGRRRAPSITFPDRAAAQRGRYRGGRRNAMEIRTPGWLDDHTMAVTTIVASVLHEIGHWADPRLPRDDRARAAIATTGVIGSWSMAVGGGAALGSGGFLFGAALVACSIAVAVVGYQLFRWVSWRGEYVADAFAAERIGRTAVIAMIEQGARTKDGATHPGLARRRAALARFPV